jgi:serine/threonine-protein kinase
MTSRDDTDSHATPGSAVPPAAEPTPAPPSGFGSGWLAQQPTPSTDETVAVAKICPQCGEEYETGSRFCPRDGSPLRPKAVGDPMIGRVIADRYLVLAGLGEGGMGRVYLAEHVKMNRQCAIKVMHPSLVNDTESSARFAREASNAARILHPNVAAVFDYGDADKVVYLVMEYVDGESLSAILARGALEPRRAIDLARQIADGLAAAHELGIVHRDLKPDNVIVTRARGGREVAKVVDFGIAKALSESPQDSLTRSGLVIGTPEYMSPEQLLGDPVDPRADVYSLGCIVYQMLTGAPAFAAESREQMIRRRLHEPPPHVRDLVPELPRRLDTLVAHMLARSPTDRLASAGAARDALDPALALGGWDPRSVSGAGGSSGAATDVTMQPTLPLPRVRASARRVAGGAIVGAAVLIGASTLWSRHVASPAPPRDQASVDTVGGARRGAPNIAAGAAGAAGAAAAARGASLPSRALVTLDSSTLHAAARAGPDGGVLAAIQRCGQAAASGDDAAMSRDCATLSDAQRTFFESLPASAEHIRVRTTVDSSAVTGDRATAAFTLRVTYDYKSLKTPAVAAPFAYHAELARQSGAWRIVSLRPRG